MSSPRPENFPWLSPYITVKDVDKSLSFYEKAFSFVGQKGDLSHDENGNTVHAQLRYEDAAIMIGAQGHYGNDAKTPQDLQQKPSLSLYLYVENVDALFKQALAAGAEAVCEPEDMFWGDRMCALKDLDGYHWCFATHLGQ